MNWYKLASKSLEDAIVVKVKGLLRTHPLFLKIMQDYHIPEQDIENHMRITFTNLDGKFAEGNGEEIRLDCKLLDGFFKQNFHFVVHEFFHWIKRRSEAIFYFNDDEEVQSFSLAIAWEILTGKSSEEIKRVFFPIISGHFQRNIDANMMYADILSQANEIVKVHKSTGNQQNSIC